MESLHAVSGDASYLRGTPGGVLAPGSVDEVATAIRWARKHRVPVVARGAGSSLDGESVPAAGALVLELAGWDRVVEVDPENRLCRVQPGVVNRTLQRELASYGLFFPPNPGSWRTSTVGGNASTNASGPRSLRYGPTRRWVRGWEAVLGTGTPLRLERGASKQSAGPDLLGLFIGSEGTLGIFTELLVELAPLPERRQAVVVPLVPDLSLRALAGALSGRAGRSCGVSAAEYLDAGTAEELHRTASSRIPGGRPVVLLEVESDALEADRCLGQLFGLLREFRLEAEATVFPEADELWTLRGEAGNLLDRRFGHRVREDVAVPISRLDELLRGIEVLAVGSGIPVYLYGHLGEANLHPNFVVDPSSAAASELRIRLLALARSLGGTISAEHGIGALKAPFLEHELGAAGVELLRGIKRLCDPDGILNPGKLLPPVPVAPGG
ncbi:MAG TPA: FAD-binding oxidoreductase [Thermoplasmata archaeon]|nr:FAD-binding oxidoreductase [Thermoplasmata archaeon]